MPHQLEASIVRIMNAAGEAVGIGFGVAERRIITCAHVVSSALGYRKEPVEMPDDKVNLDFPFLAPGQAICTRVSCWIPSVEIGDGDIAVLEVSTDLPGTARPARFVQTDNLWGHPFQVYGVPRGHQAGIWAAGRILGSIARNVLQVEGDGAAKYFLQPGFNLENASYGGIGQAIWLLSSAATRINPI